jgi:hypothetical protein
MDTDRFKYREQIIPGFYEKISAISVKPLQNNCKKGNKKI